MIIRNLEWWYSTKSTNIEVWKVIKDGRHALTKKVYDKEVPKLDSDWSVHDYKKEVRHYKVMNAIMCVMNPNELKKISKCAIAKAI